MSQVSPTFGGDTLLLITMGFCLLGTQVYV